MAPQFTKEEIRILKEMAHERLAWEDLLGKGICYRNRFETWQDAHDNLRQLGCSEKEIIKRIGKSDDRKKNKKNSKQKK